MTNKKQLLQDLKGEKVTIYTVEKEFTGILRKFGKEFSVSNFSPHISETITIKPSDIARDFESWEDTCTKRSKAGHSGGIKSAEARSKMKQKQANEADTVNENDTVNVTVNENVTVSDTDIENVTVNENESENDIPNPTSSFSFSQFWNLYNKKVGILQCETLWNELTDAEKSLIRQRLPAYIEATESDKNYRKDPFTWLSGKHWLDEYVPMQKKSAFDLIN